MAQLTDEFTRKWIIENSIPIIDNYGQQLTLRALYYRLVADCGMTNSNLHYKRVVAAMEKARWDYDIRFDSFIDLEREVVGSTDADTTNVTDKTDYAKWAIKHHMNTYNKNRWENQPIYPEVFIEKKALQGVFERPCNDNDVALSACKGYPSLTFLNEAAERFNERISQGKKVVILYFGDYDCSGEDIPRSIEQNLRRMGCHITLKRIALTESQVSDWGLPHAPTKTSDARAANWDGIGQVELDAVEPRKLRKMVEDAINGEFDPDLHDDLLEEEEGERTVYVKELKEYVANMDIDFDEEDDDE